MSEPRYQQETNGPTKTTGALLSSVEGSQYVQRMLWRLGTRVTDGHRFSNRERYRLFSFMTPKIKPGVAIFRYVEPLNYLSNAVEFSGILEWNVDGYLKGLD